MAQDPSKPRDTGHIGLPPVLPGTNKNAPTNLAEREGEEKKGSLGSGKKEYDEDALLARVRKRMERSIQFEGDNRSKALEDLKFKAGEQWPADVLTQRNSDKRPCLTINKIPTFIHQVTNAQRENRPSINISPVGDKGDPDSAKMYRGLIRSIERESSADIAYDTGFESAVSMGWGYWRILSEYETDDSFDQVLCIKRVRNPFTIYLDPESQEPEGADAKYAIVTEWLTREDFEEDYPDSRIIGWPVGTTGDLYRDWIEKDRVRVAEYYEIERKTKRLVQLKNGHEGFYDDLDESVKKEIQRNPDLILDQREADGCQLCWYKVTALEVLDHAELPGHWIPIVRVIGNEIDIEGKLKLSGLIRDSKDAQRMYNYGATAEAEVVGLAPKAPFVMEEGQVEGHEQQWKQANTKSFPYLLYKGINVNGTPAPPPQRQPLVGSPEGWIMLKQGAAQDMMATTGIRFDATMNERMVDESGIAVRELRRSGDIGSFHYLDNLGRALKHTGRILLDLIPHYYDTRRTITILREDDSEEKVKIDPAMTEPYREDMGKDGKQKIFNPKHGKYGVTVTIGPNYATRRIEAAESMLEFIKALPTQGAIIADLYAKNSDWEGHEEIASRLAKALPPQLLTPDQKDVPPQINALIQSLQAQVKEQQVQLKGLQYALNEKQSDRAVAVHKADQDFEAKIFATVEKANTAHMDRVAEMVKTVVDILTPKQATSGGGVNGAGDLKADA